MEAADRARRARAVEELRRLSTPTDAESVGSNSTPAAAEQECDHFSMRGYVAMLQKKDPTLCSPLFHNQPQYDESPVLVSEYRRWNCSKCLKRGKVSGHRPTSENVSMKEEGMDDGCSIPHMTHPSIQNVRPPNPIDQTASPPAEQKNEVASGF